MLLAGMTSLNLRNTNPNATIPFHFTPAPASWTSAAGGFSSKLFPQRLGNAVFSPPDNCI